MAGAGSMMVTLTPRRRRFQAVDKPMIPAPTTMTCTCFSLRRHDPHQVERSAQSPLSPLYEAPANSSTLGAWPQI